MRRETRNSLLALALVVAVGGGAVFVAKAIRGYRLLLSRQEAMIEWQEAVIDWQEAEAQLFVKIAMLLEGYQPAPRDGDEVRIGEPQLLFVGHTYPMNGFRGENKPEFLNREEPLEFIRLLAARSAPLRVVFGGDNVWSPSDAELDHLAQLKSKLPQARFLLGNHERYWSELRQKPEAFDSLFGSRYWYEDVDGVRLVYLHTVSESGGYGLDPLQKTFLASSLRGDDYRFALVFLHHALWAGGSRYVNTDYASADSLKNDWMSVVLPVLASGRVRAVFAGDGGVRSAGRRFEMQGIPHYVTGWTMFRDDIPPEWLSIGLAEDSASVIWHRLLDGQHYVREDAGIQSIFVRCRSKSCR